MESGLRYIKVIEKVRGKREPLKPIRQLGENVCELARAVRTLSVSSKAKEERKKKKRRAKLVHSEAAITIVRDGTQYGGRGEIQQMEVEDIIYSIPP